MNIMASQSFPGTAAIIFVTFGVWALIYFTAPYALSGQTGRHIFARIGLVLSVVGGTFIQVSIYFGSAVHAYNTLTFDSLEMIWVVEAVIGLTIAFWSAYSARSRAGK
jgi:hypothetical protein